MADNISNDSANATILAALEASIAAYAGDTTAHLDGDPQYQQLLQNGWKPITQADTPLPESSAGDTYVGIALYKVVNGVTEVIIANRGSTTSHDFLVSDAELALNGVPHADADALAYYNAVVQWASNPTNTGNATHGVAGAVNVIETGHSLGGQEADLVEAEVAGKQQTSPTAPRPKPSASTPPARAHKRLRRPVAGPMTRSLSTCRPRAYIPVVPHSTLVT